MRAYPDRVEMWMGMGHPLRHHRDLIDHYTRFFEICNTHGIEYWLEYGSLPGYVRHHGIIPGEWDMDIGCTSENFQKVLEVGELIERDDPHFGFRFYHDPDYGAPGYSFYFKARPHVLCDICEYLEQDGKLVWAVDSWHYPSQDVSDVLPIRRVIMLGQWAMNSARQEVALRNTQRILGQCTGGEDDSVNRNRIGYEQYDPVPFILTHLYNQGIAERPCSSPVLDVDEAPTIREGIDTYGRAGVPFVVRNCRIANISNEALLQGLEQGTSFVFAEVEASLEPYGIVASSLMLVLSQGLAYTPFHQDAPAEGGGWTWLAQGQKLWNMVDFEDCDTLLDCETKTLFDFAPAELLHRNRDELWGRVRQAWLEDGDFIYFPPAWGYALLPSGFHRTDKVLAWYADRDLDPQGRIWRGTKASFGNI